MTARRNHSPVSFPAGSFDREALGKGLDKAAGASAEDRAQAVTDAVKDAAGPEGLSGADGSLRPDQKLIEREHPELGIKERVRVHDPESAAAKDMAEKADRDAELLDRQAQAIAARSSEPDVELIEEPAGAELGKSGEDQSEGGKGRSGK